MQYLKNIAGCLIFCPLLAAAQNIPDSMVIKEILRQNESSKQQILQLTKEVTDLRMQLVKQQKTALDRFSISAQFLDAAVSSANSLQVLVMKESYRNKIASLNNPTSNELGFSLELEIQNAMKPLLDKARKTNAGKFNQVINSFLETGKRSPVSLFPAGNVFTSIVGMVGSLTVQERGIDQNDLNRFIQNIEKYFSQYERLYQSNQSFNMEMEKLKTRLKILQDDIKLLLIDLVITLDRSLKRQQLRSATTEDLLLRFFNMQKAPAVSANGLVTSFPPDAITGAKNIANDIQRIYEDYSLLYSNNYKEIRNIITDVGNASMTIDKIKLNRTVRDIEALYNESKTVDADNLRLKTLQSRLDNLLQ
jgi:hypothetical protein